MTESPALGVQQEGTQDFSTARGSYGVWGGLADRHSPAAADPWGGQLATCLPDGRVHEVRCGHVAMARLSGRVHSDGHGDTHVTRYYVSQVLQLISLVSMQSLRYHTPTPIGIMAYGGLRGDETTPL